MTHQQTPDCDDLVEARRAERPASGAQLFVLNRAGLLPEAMGLTPEEVVTHAAWLVVSAARARLVLTAAQLRGDWQGSPLRMPLTSREAMHVQRYNRERQRRLDEGEQ